MGQGEADSGNGGESQLYLGVFENGRIFMEENLHCVFLAFANEVISFMIPSIVF